MKIADLSRGVVIGGRFRLIDYLGDGTYGFVWKAEVLTDESGKLPNVIALKIFKDRHSANRLLFREAEIASQFDCDHLLRVFGRDRIDGLPMMWMEYIPGQSLQDLLGSHDAPVPYSIDVVLGWIRDLAEALAHMHQQVPPIGHGDLKLNNILIHPELGAKLVDFGMSRPLEAKFVDSDGHSPIPYLGPEFHEKNEQEPGKRCIASDIYAAGVIAYRILTGRFPRSTWAECLQQVPFPRSRDLNSSIPKELDDIVAKCLEKKPVRRYQTGSELLADMEKLLELMKSTPAVVKVPRPEHVETPSAVDELLEFAQRLLTAGKPDDALVRLESGMQRMSTSPRVLLLYAEALRQVGNFQTALVAYTRSLRWMDQHGWSNNEKRGAIEGLAEVNVRLKRYEQAVEHFGRLVEAWPDHRWYRYRYGVSLALEASNSKLKQSVEVLQALYEEHPSALIAAKIGKAYEELRKIDLAGQYYNEALMLDQYEPTALFQLGRLRAIQGRMDKAEECLDRLRQIEGAEDEAGTLVRLMTGE